MRDNANAELIDAFEQFYRNYYDDDIKQLAQQYPNNQRSLYIDWDDLYRFDPDLADDFINYPEQLQRYAEEALRLYDLPIDVSLGQAHVRLHNPPTHDTLAIRDLEARHANQLVTLTGRVTDASPVEAQIEEATFECQLCGTLTRVPQTSPGFQEPHECQGCERDGPFRINYNQSAFIDVQNATLTDIAAPTADPAGDITVAVKDDLAGAVTVGLPVEVTGVLRLVQQDRQPDRFNYVLEGMAVTEDDETTFIPYADDYLGDENELETFVHRSRAVINRHDTLDETNAKTKIITPWIAALGWDVFSSDVLLEYEDRDLGHRVDYALRDADNVPQVAVEAKGMHNRLDTTENRQQIKEYMRTFGTNWGVLTNGERYIVFMQDDESPTPTETRVLDCELEALLNNQEIISALTHNAYYD